MTHRHDRNGARPSFARNPLVASVLRENVRVADGRATIGLWGGCPALLADLPTFGNVLAISRNSYCVLGSVSEYPEIALIPCGNRGCAVDGSLEFDFTCWRRVIAIVEARKIFAGDETTGMYVRVERLAEVFLHNVGESLALKACDPEGRLVCAVAPPLDADCESWNAGLQSLAREFSTGRP